MLAFISHFWDNRGMKYDKLLQSYFSQPLASRLTIAGLAAASGVSKNSIIRAMQGENIGVQPLSRILECIGYKMTAWPTEKHDDQL